VSLLLFRATAIVALALGSLLAFAHPVSAAARPTARGGPNLQLEAFRDPLVQQAIAQQRRKPRDTVLCNDPELALVLATNGYLVPLPCNGLIFITTYSSPMLVGDPYFGTMSVAGSRMELTQTPGAEPPASIAVNQGAFGAAFPAAPADTTTLAYVEAIDISPYASVTYVGAPAHSLNVIVGVGTIGKGATYEMRGYVWDSINDVYDSVYSSGPFTSKYGTLADFPGIFQGGFVVPQLEHVYFVLYACANTACT
jgi:hypothetical protein